MTDHAPLIAKYLITATTADWQRLGVTPLSVQIGDRSALPEHPIWRVEEHVIGCRAGHVCRRNGQITGRNLCEHIIARDLTLAQATARLQHLLMNDEARCEE